MHPHGSPLFFPVQLTNSHLLIYVCVVEALSSEYKQLSQMLI